LNNVISWSYSLLSSEEQKLFAFLSVFSGGFTLDAAEAIFSRTVAEKSVPNLVASLLDKCLLQHIPDREGHGEPQYTMLVTIQEFARTRLREMGVETEIHNWHLAYFLDLAEKGEKEMHGPKQTEWLNRFNTMSDNMRAALEWALKSGGDMRAERLLFALRDLWFMGAHLSEGIERAKAVLISKFPAQTASARLKALNTYLYLLWYVRVNTKADPRNQDIELASIGEEALRLGHQLGDQRNLAFTLLFLGYAVAEKQNYELAHSYLDQSLEIWRSLEDETYTGLALGALGDVAMYEHEFSRAQILFEQAVPLLREARKYSYLAIQLRRLGQLAIPRGELPKAMALIRESLQLNWTIRDYDGTCCCLAAMGAWCAASGQSVCAAKLFGALDAVLEFTHFGMMPLDQQEYERSVSELRNRLDESTFTAAWMEGRAMTMEQSIEYALEISKSL
jgi:tetratricopeptide (TPR) repeat protein